MSSLFAILIGVALGALGAAPLLYMLHRAVGAKRAHTAAPSIQVGFAALVVSGLIVAVGIAIAHRFLPAYFIEVGVSASLALLILIFCAGLAAWHAMDTVR